jgi:uncharacterized protein
MGLTDKTAAHTQSPVDPQRRIEAIDMVRGFALFGVLLVNMFNFGAYSIVWNEPVDESAFSIMRVFFETKSWRLFSFLFGLGFALQLIRAETRGSKFAPVYIRRLIILYVIGAGHAMIYRGDILMEYAALGFLLIFFKPVPQKLLLVLAACLLAVFPLGRAATSLLEPAQTAVVINYSERLETENAELEENRRTHVFAVGSVREVLVDNARLKNPFTEPLGPESGVAVFAMFLLGLYAGRRRLFHDTKKHLKLFRSVFWWGLPIGLASMAAERILSVTTGYAVFRDQQASWPVQLFGDIIFTYGSTVLALAYAAGIVLLAHTDRGKHLLSPLGAAGRMALTVYISGSVMFGALFYGFAFGNAFWLGPAAVTGYAVLFFTTLMLVSVWWTNRFRFGPMEWCWRALTYLKLPPMKRQVNVPTNQRHS